MRFCTTFPPYICSQNLLKLIQPLLMYIYNCNIQYCQQSLGTIADSYFLFLYIVNFTYFSFRGGGAFPYLRHLICHYHNYIQYSPFLCLTSIAIASVTLTRSACQCDDQLMSTILSIISMCLSPKTRLQIP